MNPQTMLLADFYKLSHRIQYPKKTQVVYSTWTPRTSRIPSVDKVVVFGHQAFIKKYLINFFNDYFFSQRLDIIKYDYKRIIKHTLGDSNPDTNHIEELHHLGYLPLCIRGLPEGTLAPIRVPVLTVYNTDPRFFWLTNYVETLASCSMWQATTSATIANEYRKMLERYAMETVGNIDSVQFQGHDFSFRGMSSLETAISSGMGHLTSFVGTDTVPAILGAEEFYNANVEKELVGTSIPATEHSVECTYDNDMEYFEKLLTEIYPNGFVSIVSDGRDFWDVIGNVIPSLKDIIMARNGKLVIRPDSGDPVLIVCGNPDGKTELERKGAIEALWDIFGGTITPQGYRLLDSHIGLIYGDAITLARADEICKRLKAKGFASINAIYGIGSFTYQYNTRDTFGWALKSTDCVIDGKEKHIFKNPKTDNGVKKSQKGRVAVLQDGKSLKFIDGLNLNDVVDGDQLVKIFENGKLLVDESFSNIRNRMRQNGD